MKASGNHEIKEICGSWKAELELIREKANTLRRFALDNSSKSDLFDTPQYSADLGLHLWRLVDRIGLIID